MIPRILSLRNFLSYGDTLQVVNFDTYSLICLSGRNGNGKSALLDAMTWAVWGQARKTSGTSKPDSCLLRLGATQMLVSFEFVFNDHLYRVRREYAKTYGKPYASLDFEVFHEDANVFVSLTDKTIRKTQEKIDQTLCLDYTTFINSAFLRQGQSNEFSQKSAKERKQILTTILGLSLYDKLQQKALEKARACVEKKTILTRLNQRDEIELKTDESLRFRLKDEQSRLTQIINSIKSKEKASSTLEKKRIEIRHKVHEYDHTDKHAQQLATNQEQMRKQLRIFILKWRKAHRQILELENVEHVCKEKKKYLEKEARMRTKLQEQLQVKTALLSIEKIYQQKLYTLQSEHEKKIYNQRLILEKVTTHHNQIKLRMKQIIGFQEEKQKIFTKKKQQILSLERVQKSYKMFAHTYQVTKSQFEKRRSFYSVLLSRGNWVEQQLEDLKQKKIILNNQKTPSCPLCEQLLTTKRKKFLAAKFVDDEKLFIYRKNKVKAIAGRLKNVLIEQHRCVQKLDEEQELSVQGAVKAEEFNIACQQLGKETDYLKNEYELLEKDAMQTEKMVVKHEKELAILTAIDVIKDSELQQLSKEQCIIEKSLTSIVYDKQEHEKVEHDLIFLEKKLQNIQDISTFKTERGERRFDLRSLMCNLKNIQKELDGYQLVLSQGQFLKKKEQDSALQHKQLVDELNRAKQEKEKLLQSIAKIEHEIDRLAKLKHDYKVRNEELKISDADIFSYQQLAQAFGKNGIQALLIEEAIPEIENEANKLLAKLTNNQSQIFIESLRDLKKGGVRETLDIRISDNLGVRPYELFSGGETFRIDFALRIAISKLLACRAGTSLQTLIIDEGFGSQDEEGLQRLMDALYAIQNDFSKIIVVSHLPIFKENFPVHLIIEKNEAGSVIRVEERG